VLKRSILNRTFGPIVFIVLLFCVSSGVSAQTKLLRFPDISGDRVVFTYGGDLWTASASGGAAIRLTSHPGMEVFGKFSPDGKWIAFTGQYDGDEQVYVVPAGGGVPRQLTFYPAKGPLAPRWGWDNQVYGWSADGRRIYFKSQRDSWALPIARLYSVSIEGGPAEPLPMPEAGSGDFSPDSNRIVYSPQSRDFRPEKRYGGGQANALYIFDLKTYEAKRITEGPRATRDPVWVGNTIYFNSDRDGHFNLYSYDIPSGKTTQVTNNKTWDVRWPSSDNESRIIYELNGELQILDTNSQRSTAISINVPNEGLSSRPSRVSAAGNIESVNLSPKGERALFSARGDIFTAPIEKGPTRNLTHSSGAHDKWPSWSPDGSRIAYVSFDQKKPVVVVQNLAQGTTRVIANFRGNNSAPAWAPDGKSLAVTLTKDGYAQIYRVSATGGPAERLTESSGIDTNPAFSPDGQWLAFMSDRGGSPQIYRQPAAGGPAQRLTFEGTYNAAPRFSPDGRSIAFVQREAGKFRIATLELATGQVSVLTDGTLDDSPTFAPNGKMILYEAQVGGRGQLAAVSGDGRVRQRLTSAAGDVQDPAWGPMPTN